MRNIDSTGRRRSLLAPAIAGALAIAVAACGGAAATPPAADRTVDQAKIDSAIENLVTGAGLDISDARDDGEAAPAIEPVNLTLGQEAWFAGFHVTLNDLAIKPEGRRAHLDIGATFENLGEDEARLDATIALKSGGQPVRESYDMDVPSVPAGGAADGTFGFSIDDGFTLDDAVLTLGSPAVQQVVVPLGPNAGTLVSLEPTTVALSGAATAGQLELELDGGELRADRPESHGQMKSGKQALTIRYAATNHGTGTGMFPFTGDNVRLRLPDGTEVAAMPDGRSQSSEGIQPSSTARDLLSRFEVDAPAAGQYALLVKAGDATGEIPITLP